MAKKLNNQWSHTATENIFIVQNEKVEQTCHTATEHIFIVHNEKVEQTGHTASRQAPVLRFFISFFSFNLINKMFFCILSCA